MNKIFYKRLILSLIIIFVIVENVVVAASWNNRDVNFKSITIEDGLSQTSVEFLFQDSKGYMWIGTVDGLNKYNGYDFEVYRYNEEDPNSISSNYIAGINEDKEGNIWVGTSLGLNKIDTKTNKISKYLPDLADKKISHYNICEILIDSKDRIWVATVDGLNLYNKEKDSFERVLYDSQLGPVLSDQTVYSVQEDKHGRLWIGTMDGVNLYDEKNNTIEYFKTSSKNNRAISDNQIYEIYTDDKGFIWIGTFEGGLNRIDLETFEVKQYKSDKDDSKALQGNFVSSVLRDYNGNLWIGTDCGLSRLDEEKDEFITYKAKMYDNESLINDNVLSLTQDKTGMIWVGTYGGISLFNPKNRFKHYKNDPMNENSISNNLIAGIYEDKYGLLWIGTVYDGVNIIDRKKEKVYRFNTDSRLKLSSNEIRDIKGFEDEIYISTNKGLNIYNFKENKLEVHRSNDESYSLINDDVKSLEIAKDGTVWIGTKEGICRYIGNGKFEDYTYILEKLNTKEKLVTSIHEDKDEEIWIGLGIDGGLVRYNKKNEKINLYKKNSSKNSLSFNSIKDINEDSKGNIWIATNYGLNKLNKITGEFIKYTTKNGLDNDFIYGILVDENDNIWVSTNYGISKLNVSENKIKNFNVTDGLQSNEYNGYSYYRSQAGEMFFGGINGLNSFYPSDFEVEKNIGKVFIEGLEIQGEKLSVADKIILDKNQRQFSVNFFLPDYSNIKKNQYAYKLEGIDKEWIYSGSKNYASYSNLEHGEYVFKVVSRNSTGTWSDVSEMDITIETPLSKTPLAYTIYFVMVVLSVYIIWNRVKLLDSMVKDRTKEIEERKIKNEELLNKLIEVERYKNNYFVNLSHELRTPLNIILSTGQLITTLNKKDETIKKDKLDYYMETLGRNSRRLLNLINNIIDTSKIESGTYRLLYQEVDIVLLTEEVVLSMNEYAKGKGINLIVDPEIEEKTIECDDSEIEKCIVNIIANAIKFTPSGGEIYVRLWEESEDIFISIKDTGIGIAEEYHKSIFDRFGQAYNEASEECGGSGLGLTLTKQLITLHNGELSLSSKLGEGSTFTIKIPVKRKSD